MTELDGEIMPVSLPKFTEAPWVHKRGDWYYLSYASEFPEKIVYAMSKSIQGPWEYKSILNEIAGNSNTNHQAIVEYKGKWYFVYHNGGINNNGGSYLRSVCIDYLYYEADSTLKRIQMTTEGVDKVEPITQIDIVSKRSTLLHVYPNPTQSKLTIDWPVENMGSFLVSVTDMSGVEVFSKVLVGEAQGVVDVSNLAFGKYVLSCIDPLGEMRSCKFVIR